MRFGAEVILGIFGRIIGEILRSLLKRIISATFAALIVASVAYCGTSKAPRIVLEPSRAEGAKVVWEYSAPPVAIQEPHFVVLTRSHSSC